MVSVKYCYTEIKKLAFLYCLSVDIVEDVCEVYCILWCVSGRGFPPTPHSWEFGKGDPTGSWKGT